MPVSAQQTDIFVEHPEPIAINRSQPILLKFPYGSVFKDREVRNTAVSVTIRGQGLSIQQNRVRDQYHTDTIEEDDITYPRPWTCDGAFDGTSYPVHERLVTSTSIARYGVQSANNPDAQSGKENGTLAARHTGCLVVPVQVTDGAKPGNLIQVIFNPDVLQSDDYSTRTRPGTQTIQFRIEGDTTCDDGQEFVFGQCRAQCQDNQIRDITTVECTDIKLTCQSNQEILNNECVAACEDGLQRNVLGECTDPNTPDCTGQDCDATTACVGDACLSEENQIELSDAESRITIMFIIVILLTLVVFVGVFVIRRLQVFQNMNAPRTPYDVYPPDYLG